MTTHHPFRDGPAPFLPIIPLPINRDTSNVWVLTVSLPNISCKMFYLSCLLPVWPSVAAQLPAAQSRSLEWLRGEPIYLLAVLRIYLCLFSALLFIVGVTARRPRVGGGGAVRGEMRSGSLEWQENGSVQSVVDMEMGVYASPTRYRTRPSSAWLEK